MNVASRKSVAHSASGEPATGGEAVYDLKSDAGRRWGSVMSVWHISTVTFGGFRVKHTQWEQLDLQLLAEFLRVWR